MQKQFNERVALIEELCKKANDKNFLFVKEELISYTCLCLFKANRRHFQITQEK